MSLVAPRAFQAASNRCGNGDECKKFSEYAERNHGELGRETGAQLDRDLASLELMADAFLAGSRWGRYRKWSEDQ